MKGRHNVHPHLHSYLRDGRAPARVEKCITTRSEKYCRLQPLRRCAVPAAREAEHCHRYRKFASYYESMFSTTTTSIWPHFLISSASSYRARCVSTDSMIRRCCHVCTRFADAAWRSNSVATARSVCCVRRVSRRRRSATPGSTAYRRTSS